MNVVFLFLNRRDLSSIAHLPQWMTENGVKRFFSIVSPHLGLEATEDQLYKERAIHEEMVSGHPDSTRRLQIEMEINKAWWAIPREDFLARLNAALGPQLAPSMMVLNESLQADRLSEILNKTRGFWPPGIPQGEFVLMFANQIPEPRKAGRPPGSANKPKEDTPALKIKRERTPAQKANDERLRAAAAEKRKNALAGV